MLAYNEQTGEQEYKEVVRLFRNETDEWYNITINGETLSCTGGHPFYVPAFDKYIPARELQVGTKLLLSDGNYGIIESVEIEQLDTPETTYNFEVEDFHTYYVGTNKVLCHNMCKVDSVDDALDWSRKRPDGITTEEHVRLHEVPDNTKSKHSIFNGDSVNITNKAWGMRETYTVNPYNGNKIYQIPYAQAGMTGGRSVLSPQVCNGVQIVILKDTTNLLVTAYPIIL